jgi:hypothetical protein
MVQVADLLLEGRGVLVLETHVAPEAPGLDLIAALFQEGLQNEQRRLVAHETGQQQHRMPIAARCRGQQRPRPWQQGRLQEGARFDRLEQRMRTAGVAMTAGRVGPRGVGDVHRLVRARHRGESPGAPGRGGAVDPQRPDGRSGTRE